MPALNGLYKDYRLYVNFFQPVLKLQSKTRPLSNSEFWG